MGKFDQVQEQINKSKKLQEENEKKRASNYYKDRTTVAVTKNTRALINDLANENRVKIYEMIEIMSETYAQNNHPERYEKYLKKELKGQKS